MPFDAFETAPAEHQALKAQSLCDDRVEELAEQFEVSEQSMTIRLSTPGFL
jgi:hypothetical protein